MTLQYPTVVLILLLLSSPFRAYRLYKSRAEALEMLDEKEGRLHFDICEQSSNTESCVFAMDNSQSQEPTQCALTQSEDQPWWMAILELPAYVTKVTVLNIDNSFRSYLDALNSMVVMASGESCFRYQSQDPFVKRSFPCDVVADQIVIQSQLNAAVLGVCDVEVLGAPVKFPTVFNKNSLLPLSDCLQSSLDGNGFCENAFDGETNSNHLRSPCAVTLAEDSPWIDFYLAKPGMINEVRLFNRGDCCADGMGHIEITLNGKSCAEYKEGAFTSKTFICKNFGDKVRITSYQTKAMSICEIQVLGHVADINFPDKYMSLGCHNDKEEDRDLPTLVSSTRMSLQKCYGICNRNGTKYFGVQQGKFCFCGNDVGKHGKAASKESCDTACDGEKREICGGIMLNSVFQILGPGETIPKPIEAAEETPPESTATADTADTGSASGAPSIQLPPPPV